MACKKEMFSGKMEQFLELLRNYLEKVKELKSEFEKTLDEKGTLNDLVCVFIEESIIANVFYDKSNDRIYFKIFENGESGIYEMYYDGINYARFHAKVKKEEGRWLCYLHEMKFNDGKVENIRCKVYYEVDKKK